jgi:hypothetical protein
VHREEEGREGRRGIRVIGLSALCIDAVKFYHRSQSLPIKEERERARARSTWLGDNGGERGQRKERGQCL